MRQQNHLQHRYRQQNRLKQNRLSQDRDLTDREMKAADHKAQAEEKAVQLETATDSPDEDSVGMITVMGKEEA